MIKAIDRFIGEHQNDIIAYFILIMYIIIAHPEKAKAFIKLFWLFMEGASHVQS